MRLKSPVCIPFHCSFLLSVLNRKSIDTFLIPCSRYHNWEGSRAEMQALLVQAGVLRQFPSRHSKTSTHPESGTRGVVEEWPRKLKKPLVPRQGQQDGWASDKPRRWWRLGERWQRERKSGPTCSWVPDKCHTSSEPATGCHPHIPPSSTKWNLKDNTFILLFRILSKHFLKILLSVFAAF